MVEVALWIVADIAILFVVFRLTLAWLAPRTHD
jgi:hypothetical protein